MITFVIAPFDRRPLYEIHIDNARKSGSLKKKL